MNDHLMTPLDASLYALTIAIQPARRAWIQAAGAALASSGLSVSLATIVVLVARLGPGVQQKTLATEAGVNPAALVRTLDQGEAAGLLARRDIPDNRRIKVVDLLPEGQTLARKMEESLAQLRKTVLQGIPVQEIETTARVLRLLEAGALAHVKDERQG